MTTRRLLIYLAFLAPLYLFGVKYPFINYQTPEGLPQNQINTLSQDKLGYILVGTQSGIGKFNGLHFETITKLDGLSHNFITGIISSNHQETWISSHEGLNKYDPATNKITTFMPRSRILSISFNPLDETLWMITRDGPGYLQEGKPFKYTKIPSEHISDQHFKGIYVDSKGHKYIYSNTHIIHITPGEQFNSISIDEGQQINIVKNLGQQIAVGTTNGLYSIQDNQLHPFTLLPTLTTGMQNVSDFVRDNSGNYWIGTTQGLFHFNPDQNTTRVITNRNGLVNNNVTRMFIDRENNLFIGTLNGLSQLALDHLVMYDAHQDQLPHELVWCYEEDENGLILGCNNGLARFTLGRIQPLSINKRLKAKSLRAIIKYNQNQYLIGTRNSGIYLWDGGDRLQRIHTRAHVLSAVSIPQTDIAWFGTDDGLLKYDGKEFQYFREGLRDKNIWSLALQDSDTLLLGTGKGIQKLHKQNIVSCKLEMLIPQSIINDIHIDNHHRVLVATQMHGLFIFTPQTSQLVNLTTENGLLHNDVWAVITDNSGNTWFNTSVSIDRYANGFISHFNKNTGLFGSGEGSIHSVYKSMDGNIYFGIAPGIVEIPAAQKSIPLITPILYINRVTINDNPASLRENLDLAHNQNNLQFHYIAVSTRKENPVQYRTRLSPLETQWSHASPDTAAKYLSLPPGQYTFEVQANNGGGQNRWIKSENQIQIFIARPFWLSWWVISIAVLLGISLIILLIKWRIFHLEKQKKQLEEIVEERTQEIIRKNKELVELSITDPLTDLKNRRYLEEKIKEDISLIKRNIYDQQKCGDNIKQFGICVLGVYILDIDYFKRVNDLYGHNAGDIVIVEIAQLLLRMLRNSDTIVRWGGEEFLVITRQREKDNTYELAERIRKTIENHPFQVDEDTVIHKTVSIGYAHFPFIPGNVTAVSWAQVLSLADSALYLAKRNGRNLTVGITPGSQPIDIDFKELMTDLKQAVEKEYINLVSKKRKYKFPPGHKHNKNE